MGGPPGLRPLDVRYLGRRPYRETWAWQRELVAQRKAGAIPDTLLLLEHDPVITVGRNAGTASLLLDEAGYAARGVELVISDRGGDATYHGPGQIVAYPIFDLRPDWMDIKRFVRMLEQAMIDTCADHGVAAGRLPGEPGTWLDGPDGVPDRKIGAVGLRFSRWVTQHGLALNVNTDLAAFDLIVPCGIQGKGVTSLQRERGQGIPVATVMAQLAGHIARLFGATRVTAGPPIGDTVGPS